MGFDVGTITRIDAQPPDDIFNVYVEFQVRQPYFGYLWTQGSKARVAPSGFMGDRLVEVTKGTNGVPTHLTCEIREYTPAEAAALSPATQYAFLEALRLPDATNQLTEPLQPLDPAALNQLAAVGVARLKIVHRTTNSKKVTAVWNFISGRYEPYAPKGKPYWLPPDESPALTERLDDLLQHARAGLPGLLLLTNHLAAVLTNTARLTAHADDLLLQTRPLLTNLNALTAALTNGEGALGRWLLSPELYAQTLTTLTNTSATLTNASAMLLTANTNFAALIGQLQQPLQNLSTIISNLNLQVHANTNFVTTLHDLLADTDSLIEGLKRHWLFRGAFKPTATNTPPAKPPRPPTPPRL
jgi:ABC-type transporter Mla subunit MlaD